MPELPEVETIVRACGRADAVAALVGRVIRRRSYLGADAG